MASYLLLQDGGHLLTQDGFGILLELEDSTVPTLIGPFVALLTAASSSTANPVTSITLGTTPTTSTTNPHTSGSHRMTIFYVKQNDLVPALTATLMQQVGTAAATVIDLTTASSIKFAMRSQTGTIKVDAAGTIVSAAAGTVKYQWVGTDTDTTGTYDCEWQITWPAGKQTVPGASFDQIVIGDDIAT